MQFHLIRHCPVDMAGICYGRSDISAQGFVAGQREHLISALPPEDQILRFSSPLKRCRILAKSLWVNACFDDRLLELNFGRWEGELWDDIDRHALDEWAINPLTFAAPEGESFEHLIRRVALWRRDAIAQAKAQGLHHIAAVTHAGVIKAMAVLCNGTNVSEALALQVPYAQVVRYC